MTFDMPKTNAQSFFYDVQRDLISYSRKISNYFYLASDVEEKGRLCYAVSNSYNVMNSL